MTIRPETNACYVIELCSGELRRWRCLGADAHGQMWWQDVESGLEFGEASLMYAWQIVRREDDGPAP